MEIDLLAYIKEKKRRGDIGLVATKLNFSTRYIHKVLKGDSKNENVTTAFLDLFEDRKQQNDTLKNRINKLEQ